MMPTPLTVLLALLTTIFYCWIRFYALPTKDKAPIERDCYVSMSFSAGYLDSYAVTGSVDGVIIMSHLTTTPFSINTGAGYTLQGYIKGNPAQIKSIVKAICVATKNSNCADAMRLYAKQLKGCRND